MLCNSTNVCVIRHENCRWNASVFHSIRWDRLSKKCTLDQHRISHSLSSNHWLPRPGHAEDGNPSWSFLQPLQPLPEHIKQHGTIHEHHGPLGHAPFTQDHLHWNEATHRSECNTQHLKCSGRHWMNQTEKFSTVALHFSHFLNYYCMSRTGSSVWQFQDSSVVKKKKK